MSAGSHLSGVQGGVRFQQPWPEAQALNLSGCHLLDQLYRGAVIN